MKAPELINRVGRYYELFVAAGWEELASLLAQDVSWAGPLFAAAGRKEVLKVIMAWRTAFPDLSLRQSYVVGNEDVVVAKIHIRGTHGGPLGHLEPDGRRISLVVMNEFQFRDVEICDIRQYFDVSILMSEASNRLFGLAPR